MPITMPATAGLQSSSATEKLPISCDCCTNNRKPKCL